MRRHASCPAKARRATVASDRDFNKDLHAARDAAGRSTRLATLKESRRRPSLALDAEALIAPPLVRAPRTVRKLKNTSEGRSEAWLDQKLRALFRDIDVTGLKEVSLAELHASFAKLNMAIDPETFRLYKQQQLPPDCDCVDVEAFVSFYQAVWENQPPSVRRFAGCPEAGAVAGALHVSPKGKRLPTLVLPCQNLLREAADNEDQLRAAFYRYTKGNLYLSRSQMPAVLKDLGITVPEASAPQLDLEFFQTFCDHEFDNADENKDGKVSFQECIAYQNRYLSMMQATSLGIVRSFRDSVLHNKD